MDLNRDGYNDILSGSYSRMSQPMAGLFQVLWGQPNGSFKEAAVLNGTDGEPLIIPADNDSITECICTRPMAVDWDADGELDLVVGNFSGSFYVFSGNGQGKFTPQPKQILTDNGPLKISGAHSDPFPVDWDRDGDIDLLSGSSNGGVQWAENLSSDKKAPTFERFRSLIEPGQLSQSDTKFSDADLTGPTGSTRIWVDDFNADGKLDLFVGDCVMLVKVPEGLSAEESQKKQKDWQETLARITEEYTKASSSGKQDELRAVSAKLRALYAQRSEFIIEDRTGFVWLYLQK